MTARSHTRTHNKFKRKLAKRRRGTGEGRWQFPEKQEYRNEGFGSWAEMKLLIEKGELPREGDEWAPRDTEADLAEKRKREALKRSSLGRREMGVAA